MELPIGNCQLPILVDRTESAIGNWQSAMFMVSSGNTLGARGRARRRAWESQPEFF